MSLQQGKFVRQSLLLSAVFFFCIAINLAAQSNQVTTMQNGSATPQNAQIPAITVNANTVVVDVVVTKGKGDAVPGLTKESFQIFEDGKPRTIDFFEEHVGAEAPATGKNKSGGDAGGSGAKSAQPAVGEVVTVLLIDTLNTPLVDQSYARKGIIDYLKTKPANQRIAIFTLSNRLRMAQNFTTDSSALLASLENKKKSILEATTLTVSPATAQDDQMQIALQSQMSANGNQPGTIETTFAGGVEGMQQMQLAQRAEITMNELNTLARALLNVPGRKNLVWFSSTFPAIVFPASMQGQAFTQSERYQSSARKTVALLTASRVAIYPVSAQGIQQAIGMQAEEGSNTSHPDRYGSNGTAEAKDLNHTSNLAAMDELALDTGGVANDSTNDLSRAIQEATRNGSSYYTVAFSPASSAMDGKYHRIDVKVAGQKVKLNYRRGYYAEPVDATAKPGN